MYNRIFIASPLFNPPQIEIIERIETILSDCGFNYYSARKHSGSDKLSPEDRKNYDAWQPVFDSNEAGLDECSACIAVLEYAMPDGISLELVEEGFFEHGHQGVKPDVGPLGLKRKRLEIPDAGTVWEVGYMRAQGKLVFGFHTDKAKHLNLMLSHGVDGLVRGFDNLHKLLYRSSPVEHIPASLDRRAMRYREAGEKALRLYRERQAAVEFNRAAMLEQTMGMFDWTAVERFDAENKEVE